MTATDANAGAVREPAAARGHPPFLVFRCGYGLPDASVTQRSR